MKKFYLNCCAFGIIIILIVSILNQDYYPSKAAGYNGFMGAIVDKHAFANSVKSPRIILCGGSNLSFGLNSEEIQKKTGMPVVNLGLNGSLGLSFIINETKYIARPSDIVIISSEYFLSVDGSYSIKKMAARIFPEANKFFKPDISQFLNDFFIEDLQNNLPVTLSKWLKIKEKSTGPTVYSRSSYNANGDVVRNFTANPPRDFLNKFTLDYSYYPGIKVLNDFKLFADKNHIKVFYVYPCLPVSLYNSKISIINKLASDFDHNLKIKILNKPLDSVFPDSLFYNTEYHLDPRGRELRTQKVIKLLVQNRIGRY